MVEEYYIFSDETGHWSQEGYYIRSWVALNEDDYLKLKGKMSLFKAMHSISSEVKFNHNHDYSIFSDLKFKVYYTFTQTDDFKNRTFDVITHLNAQPEALFTINSKNIKERIILSVKQEMFLNIFEHYHLENAIKFFNNLFAHKKLNFLIDSPQYHKKHWEKIFKDLQSEEFRLMIVSKSQDFEGIQFADILAGSLSHILEKIDTLQPTEFEKKIIENFSMKNGQTEAFKNNPQIVMWKPEHKPLMDKIQKLITTHIGRTQLPPTLTK